MLSAKADRPLGAPAFAGARGPLVACSDRLSEVGVIGDGPEQRVEGVQTTETMWFSLCACKKICGDLRRRWSIERQEDAQRPGSHRDHSVGFFLLPGGAQRLLEKAD